VKNKRLALGLAAGTAAAALALAGCSTGGTPTPTATDSGPASLAYPNAFRTGWQFDYPSQANILTALYLTGSGSNDALYSNPAFDDLINKGLTASSFDEQTKYFGQAQEILFQDLPAIPLWYSSLAGGFSSKVQNVQFGWDSWPLLEQVTKADGSPVTAHWNEPENPLIPANTNEVGGGLVLNNIFAGLVYYEADGSYHNDVAESIESDDSQHWTIKIKSGQTFADGSPVTADSFVKAWQWGASDPELLNQWWFANIDGYSPDGGENTLALKVVDDTTFTVDLVAPQADFPVSLGYTVFMPLPESFFADPDAFGQAPIGNGPYQIAPDSWIHDSRISLVPNPSYSGPRKPANSQVDLVVYTSLDAAYADLLGDNLDILDQVPASALATFKKDLGDRAVEQAIAVFQSFTIMEGAPHFTGEEGKLRRAALSMAINRPEITDVIFQGTRTPAKDWTSPVIAGWSDSIPGSEVLDYNPDKAVELWKQADAISPWSGTFQLAYNADGGHQEWVDATVNSIKNVLGIDAAGLPYPDFAGLRTEVNDAKKAVRAAAG